MDVSDRGAKVPVFYYPTPDMEAAAHYNAVQEFFRSRGLYAVYFAPSRLPETKEYGVWLMIIE